MEYQEDALTANPYKQDYLNSVEKLIQEGYLKPLREKYPEKKITVMPRYHNAQIGGEEHG